MDAKTYNLKIYTKLINVEIKYVKTDTQKHADSKKTVDSNFVVHIIIQNMNPNRMPLRKLKVSQKIFTFLTKKLTPLR